jgi:DNA-directed RNA polymerase subunit RPC12/RpoP
MVMCSVGGPMIMDIIDVESDSYRCDACGEEFPWEGKGKKKAACPKCKSKKVTKV